jgi:hypothetical protein
MSQENVEIIEEAWRATNHGDVDALLGLLTDDVDLRPPSHRLDGDCVSRPHRRPGVDGEDEGDVEHAGGFPSRGGERGRASRDGG